MLEDEDERVNCALLLQDMSLRSRITSNAQKDVTGLTRLTFLADNHLMSGVIEKHGEGERIGQYEAVYVVSELGILQE